jgi:hypothetical protein
MGQADIVEALLNKGADPKYRDKNTALAGADAAEPLQ